MQANIPDKNEPKAQGHAEPNGTQSKARPFGTNRHLAIMASALLAIVTTLTIAAMMLSADAAPVTDTQPASQIETVDETHEGADAIETPSSDEDTQDDTHTDETTRDPIDVGDPEDPYVGADVIDTVNANELDKVDTNDEPKIAMTAPKLVTNKLMGTYSPMAANIAPLPSDAVNEADGYRIENISVEWITTDSDDDDARLNLTPSDDTPLHVRMRVNFALSGKSDWDVGDIEVAVPKNIFTYRDGTTAGYMTLSVPEAPDSRATFAYTDMGDYYLLSNTKRLTAAANAMIEFSIKNLTPHLLIGNPEKYISDAFLAQISAITPEGTQLQAESNRIDCTIDTSEKVTAASNRVNDFWTDDDYVYVDWYSYAWPTGNQSYSMSVKHDIALSDVQGEIYQMTGADSVSGTSAETQLTDNTYTTSGYSAHYVHLYAKFPRSAFEDGKNYTLSDTVTYTLADLDDQTVTTASATATKTIRILPYVQPTGHFAVNKYGVSYTSGRRSNANLDYSGQPDYYGGYLNRIENGQDIDLRYSVETIGYGAPWTYKDLDNDGVQDAGELGQYSYTLDTYDSTVSLDGVDGNLPSDEYKFAQLKVTSAVAYDWGQGNVFSDWSYKQKQFTGTVDLYVTLKGSTTDTHVATLTYKNGAVTTTCENGASATGATVTLPDGVTGWHSSVTTKEAGIIYYVQPTIRLDASAKTVAGWAHDLFANSDTPQQNVRNYATGTASFENGEPTVDITVNGVGNDILTGAAQAANIIKALTYENDTSNSQVKLHYTATTRNQSNITDSSEYDKLVDDGVLTEETGGVFYDLLPRDVFADLDSIQTTYGADTITSIKTYENYKNSGRTLLVVKLDETPNRHYSSSVNTLTGYGEAHGIKFDAVYSWESMSQYGARLDNVVSYESDNEKYGTVKGYTGEPDNPTYGNANASKSAVAGVESIMTDLDKDRNDPSFVYGHATNTLYVDIAALINLNKKVAVNGNGEYGDGQGKYPLNAYEGGIYTYRLTQTNSPNTAAKNIVIYDALEQYVPTVDDSDYQDIQWKGTLDSIDLSSIRNAGAAPVIYYSTKTGIELMDATSGDFDIDDADIWTKAEDFTDDMADITGIAIDCRHDAEGNEFTLEKGESMSAYVNMNAPTLTPEQQGTYYDTDLADDQTEAGTTGGAHAYNAVSMKGTVIAANSAEGEKEQFIYQKYVKVGMVPFEVTTKKIWDDGSNRDGKRPDSITLHLYADGTDTGKAVTLSDENKWQASFGTVAKYKDGNPISYTIIEDAVSGYTYKTTPTIDGNVMTLNVTNTHEPEKISIAGTKIWADNNNVAGDRPAKIALTLYKNGEKYKSMDVTGSNSTDTWDWHFDDLFKYENGTEIKWTVSEDAYYAGYKKGIVDDSDITAVTVTNERYPYGDLAISKTIVDATDASKDTEFEVTLYVNDAEGEPDAGTYKLIRTDKDGNETTGTVAQGGIIRIRGDETVLVKDIPSECTYELVESDAPGWTLTTATNRTGTIKAGQMSKAALTNTYASTGSIQLTADKTLTGRDASGGLEARQFTFMVKDADGTILRRTTNAADGLVTFGRLNYTLDDIGTHTYTIAETIPNEAQAYDSTGNAITNLTWGSATNAQKTNATYSWRLKGYTYDAHVETVTVKVEDNGDGTLAVTPTYDTDGTKFTNEYHATGTVTPKAWKQLNGQDLRNGQFTFSLEPSSGTDTNGNDIDVANIPTSEDMTATNDAEGTITWNGITFDESDVGNTYVYVAREIKDDDDTVTYSDQAFRYVVTVYDNGDGTLSFDATTKSGDGKAKTQELDLTLTANEAATIDLPEGSGYTVMELTDAGWQVVKHSTVSGAIDSTTGNEVIFTNEEKGDKATADLYTTVTLDDLIPEEGAFGFTLLDADGTTVDSATNNAGGFASFKQLTFSKTGTYTYKIHQDTTTKTGVTFDSMNDIEVTVTVTKDDTGNLKASIDYTSEPAFANTSDGTSGIKVIEPSIEPEKVPASTPSTNPSTASITSGGNTNTSSSTSTVTSGQEYEREITLEGNQSATLDGIPAGSTYTIYEETPAGWVEVGSANASGTVSANGDTTATFTNEYVTGTTQATITTQKTVDGSTDVESGKYSFALKDNTGVTLQTVTNTDGGGVVFKPIKYTKAGTYTYTVTEIAGTDASINYDSHTLTATVTVTDDSAGNLASTVSYTGLTTFNNTTKENYKHGSIAITKKVTGTTRANDEFTFNVALNGGIESRTVTVKAGETATIADIPVGTTYEVTETSMPDGYTLTDIENATGTVKPDAEGTATVTATNAYSATGSFGAHATKTLDGEAPGNDASFDFELYESDNVGNVASDAKPLATASSNATGDVIFDAVSVNKTGTFYYVMREVEGDTDTYRFDTSSKLVKVVVTDGDAGRLDCTVTYPSGSAFANTTKPGILTITKNVKNRSHGIDGKTYTITLSLKDAHGKPVEGCAYTTTTGKSGLVSDGDTINMVDGETVTVTVPGNTSYNVTETPYDGFAVTYEGETGTVTPSSTTAVTINNAYTLTPCEYAPAVAKNLIGDILKADMFTFELIDENGTVVDTKTNDTNGKVSFSALTMPTTDGATRTYTIREVDDGNEQFTFDKTIVTLTITAYDNGDGTMTATGIYTNGTATSGIMTTGEVGWTFSNVKLLSMPVAGINGIPTLACYLGIASLVALAQTLHCHRMAIRNRHVTDR